MNADWKAGDKAVCVDDSPNPDTNRNHHLVRHTTPVKGRIYLVSDVVLRDFKDKGLTPRLILAGESLVWTPDGQEYGFHLSRFRKVVPACDRVSIHQEETA